MCSVEELSEIAVTVEEVFEMEDGAVAHGVTGQTFDEFRMATVDRLEGFSLVLNGGPGVA